jgi:hypothetical protein
MRFVLLVVVLSIVAFTVLGSRRALPVGGKMRSQRRPPRPRAFAPRVAGRAAVPVRAELPEVLDDDALDRWASLGLISAAQAEAIRAHEAAVAVPASTALAPAGRSGRHHGVTALAEALGYLGGILASVGLLLVVSRYWPDMATAARLALAGAGSLGLLAAGFLVRGASPAIERLRGFLWLASTATAGVFAGVVADSALGLEGAAPVAIAASGMIAVHSAALWRGRDRPLQQVAVLAGGAVFVGTLVSELAVDGVAGLAVWLVGVAYLVLGLRRLTPLPVLTVAAGALAVIVGAVMTASTWQAFGLPFAVASALGLLALAAVPRFTPELAEQRVLGVLGAIGLLQLVPGTLGYFAEGAGLITGLVTWSVGAALVAIGAHRLFRAPVLTEVLGGVALLGGAALTAAQVSGFGPVLGIVTALGLLGLGMLPGQAVLSVLGSAGLLVNVPWAIGELFPGEGRAPLLIMVVGLLLIAVAVLLTRMGSRLRKDLAG